MIDSDGPGTGDLDGADTEAKADADVEVDVDVDPDADVDDAAGEADTAGPRVAGVAGADDPDALAALVRRIMNQDEAALAELYRCLAVRVFQRASRLIRDLGTAEEVVEDVFWQVWRQAPRFDATRGTVLAWVMQIARSRSLDALRARGRHPLFAALELEGDACTPVAEDADPAGLVDRSRAAACVQSALGQLDPQRRQLVSMAYEQGYSQAEIAERTGLPLGTVKSHIRRALGTMKTLLESTLSATTRHPT